jgi:thymidylate synthase (FAD)
MSKVDVLDKGYVRLVDVMGNELSIVNAARVSYDKESQELDEKDLKLLSFLIREKHLSPLRHVSMTFEVYSPLMVARQHWKYAVASTFVDDQNGWNESSRRYVTEKEEFYTPRYNEWRSKPENSKQGSGEPIDVIKGREFSKYLTKHFKNSEALYKEALKAGIAPEQARLFLPAYSMYIRYRWTVSLASLLHFLEERLKDDAQFEIKEYALAINSLVQPYFPNVFKEIFKQRLTDSAVVAIQNESFGAPKNESKRETIKKLNEDMADIVDKAKIYHDAGTGDWAINYNPDPIKFNMEDKS